jgi:rod shape-determining protein MreC
MDTSRGDIGIAIRSAFLRSETKQRFSLLVLIIISTILIFIETIETKPLNAIRSVIKDFIYRGAVVSSYPIKAFSNIYNFTEDHITLYNNYENLKVENKNLKNQISKSDFLEMENSQLKELIEDKSSTTNYISARVMLDKQSPYLNSLIVNIGTNKNIKKGMAALDGKNFIGRIVDVNFFSSRILLISDLNSKIPVILQPSGNHAILSGHGINLPTLEYLPKNNQVKDGDKIYTSGKEGIFTPGIPIGVTQIEKNNINVLLFSDLSQITFVNIQFFEKERKENFSGPIIQ